MTACIVFVGAGIATGAAMEDFSGGGTWQSLVVAGLEGIIVVTMSLWLIDLFQRRFDHQGPLAREMSRAAYATFVVHQVVLVWLVLATRLIPWPPEIEYLAAAVIGVVASFGVGSALIRIPWLRTAVGG